MQVRAGRIRRKPSEIPEEEEKQDLCIQGMLIFLKHEISWNHKDVWLEPQLTIDNNGWNFPFFPMEQIRHPWNTCIKLELVDLVPGMV